MVSDGSSVPDEVVQATFDASRALLAIIARSLESALEEVTLAQFRVLVVLTHDGPLRMGALAERVGVSPSTLTRTVERMIAGQWAARESSPTSRREVVVTASDKGAALVEDVMQRRKDELRVILADLPPSRREQVQRSLGAFASAAGETSVIAERWPVL